MPRESGYYPHGAEFDPRAPWNEVEIDDEPCHCGNDKGLGEDQCGECDDADYADWSYESRRDAETWDRDPERL